MSPRKNVQDDEGVNAGYAAAVPSEQSAVILIFEKPSRLGLWLQHDLLRKPAAPRSSRGKPSRDHAPKISART
jgi:hypothetical protein